MLDSLQADLIDVDATADHKDNVYGLSDPTVWSRETMAINRMPRRSTMINRHFRNFRICCGRYSLH